MMFRFVLIATVFGFSACELEDLVIAGCKVASTSTAPTSVEGATFATACGIFDQTQAALKASDEDFEDEDLDEENFEDEDLDEE